MYVCKEIRDQLGEIILILALSSTSWQEWASNAHTFDVYKTKEIAQYR